MTINGVECTFHHLGIPTTEQKPRERFSEAFGMYTSDSACKALRIQWHRFEANSSLHPLIRTVPHVALKVADLDRAIAGCSVLLGPYEPIPDFRVAIIEDGGIPVELVQTNLTDEELWSRSETDNLLYDQRSRDYVVSRTRDIHLEGSGRRPHDFPDALAGSHVD